MVSKPCHEWDGACQLRCLCHEHVPLGCIPGGIRDVANVQRNVCGCTLAHVLVRQIRIRGLSSQKQMEQSKKEQRQNGLVCVFASYKQTARWFFFSFTDASMGKSTNLPMVVAAVLLGNTNIRSRHNVQWRVGVRWLCSHKGVHTRPVAVAAALVPHDRLARCQALHVHRKN